MPSERRAEAKVDPLFIGRWSPRVFKREAIPQETLRSLFEAARWAPSSWNDQPWLFLYATTEDDHKRFASLLVDANRVWAERAPVLMFILARKHLNRDGKPNRHYAFDSGSAWMSLALAAHKLGLAAHGMAGFDHEKSYEVLGVPRDKYEVMAAAALGKPSSDLTGLPEAVVKSEKERTPRKPLAEVAIEGGFKTR